PVVTEGRLRASAHPGQPAPLAVRWFTVACHSCPNWQRHHTRWCAPRVTSRGVSVPFFVGCQSRATFGPVTASEFVEEIRRVAQKGQPKPVWRLATLPSHS